MSSVNQIKKQAILKAALELFADQGFHDAPMALLATRAKVGVGSIYRYFIDKNGLIDSLYHEVDAVLQQAMMQGVERHLTTRQQFLKFIANLVHFLDQHPQEFKFLEQYYHSPFGIDKKREQRLLENRAGRQNHFMELFFNGNNEEIKRLPVSVLLSLAFGPVHFLLRDSIAGLVELNDTVISQVAEGCWDAIKSRTV